MYILDDTDCRINLHFAYVKVWKKSISIDRIYFTAFRKRFMETLKDIENTERLTYLKGK